MSQASKAASELGRRLVISRSNMPAQGRAQSRRDSQQRPQSKDDSSSDEESDDDSDDGDPTAALRLQMQRRRIQLLTTMSVFDPAHRSPSEFCSKDARQMEEPSRSLKNLTEAVVRLCRTEDDYNYVARQMPLNGSVWGCAAAAQLQERVAASLTKFQATNNSHDALNTLQDLRDVYDSVESIMRDYPQNLMSNDNKAKLILLLAIILERISQYNFDIRSRQGSQVYAGGSGQHEYNLYMRFVSSNSTWTHFLRCWATLTPLAGTAGFFQQQSVRESLARTWVNIKANHPNGLPVDATKDFAPRFAMMLRSWSIIP